MSKDNPYKMQTFVGGQTPAQLEAAEKASQSNMLTSQAAMAYASVFSSAASIYSAWVSSKSQKRVYAIKAKMAELQAHMAQNRYEDILRNGHQNVASITYRAGQVKAKSRVGIAASGVRAGTGSAAEVMASHDIVKEMQVNQTLANALTEAYGAKRTQIDASNKAIAVNATAQGINPWASALNSGVSSLFSSVEKGYLPNPFSASGNQNQYGKDSGLKG